MIGWRFPMGAVVLLSLFPPAPGRLLGQDGPATELGYWDSAALLAIADEYRVPGLEDRRFTHEEYWGAVDAALERIIGTPVAFDARATASSAS